MTFSVYTFFGEGYFDIKISCHWRILTNSSQAMGEKNETVYISEKNRIRSLRECLYVLYVLVCFSTKLTKKLIGINRNKWWKEKIDEESNKVVNGRVERFIRLMVFFYEINKKLIGINWNKWWKEKIDEESNKVVNDWVERFIRLSVFFYEINKNLIGIYWNKLW